ncbi:RNA polymerase sigma factor [Mucilaginibacter sp. P25]|uniref:RNA polymerase sigma factor n=1 Tax=Mucilaginibacter sp. P25 TaxID=3423945 RepID=UPI003D7AE2A6
MAHVNYNSLSDSEVCQRIKRSDHFAYTEIYHRYFEAVFQHAFRKLGDEDVASDIVQEVFVNLWANRDTYNININPKSYLFTSVRNRIFNFWAKENVRSAYWDTFRENLKIEEQMNASTDHKVREQQLKNYIEQQIQDFSPRMKEIFQLSRHDQLSHKEIAEKLDTTEVNVSRQISNALKVLRAKLGMIALACLAFLTLF